jgi:hypothetical protein
MSGPAWPEQFISLANDGEALPPIQLLAAAENDLEVRDGAKITKKYDAAAIPTPALSPTDAKALPKRRLRARHASFNPAAMPGRSNPWPMSW